jgi:hypothetical protein
MHEPRQFQKRAVAQFESIAYTGVILYDLSREESCAYRTIGAPSYISASRWILRKLTMTPSIQDRNPNWNHYPSKLFLVTRKHFWHNWSCTHPAQNLKDNLR